MKKRIISLILAVTIAGCLVCPAAAVWSPPPFGILFADLSLAHETDGLADGTLTLVMKSGFPDSTIKGYWADQNGPIRSCTALAPFSVTEGINRIQMKASTIIPPGSDRLLLYQVSEHGISDECFTIALPAGAAYEPDSEPLYEFQVISDTHIRADWAGDNNFNFHRALMDISATSRDSAAIIINGDMTNRGLPQEYDILMQTYREVAGLPDMYLSMGNHEFFSSATHEEAVALFLETASLPDDTHPEHAYYDFYLDSAHFIVLAPDCSSDLDDGVVWCSEAQLEWLSDCLSDTPDHMQTFVFLHEAIENTVSGSYPEQEWGSYQDGGALYDILTRHSAVLFTSHTHWTLNDADTLYQDAGLSILNTAAVCSLWTSETYPEGEYLTGSQGYYVRVYDDHIEILGRDFTTGRWIPSAMFSLSCP